MGGFCDDIEVAFLPGNRIRVADNGRGVPIDIHKKTKVSALETVMTTLHAGGKFGGENSGYKVSGGMLTRDNITFISFEQTRSYGQGESILTKHVSFSEIVDKLIIDFDNPFLQAVSKNGIMTTISTDKGLYLANFSTKEITKICNNEQKCDSEFF